MLFDGTCCCLCFFFNDTATTEIYTLSLHDALPIFGVPSAEVFAAVLTYRVIAFWLPIPPGIVAFFQLRKTVNRWEREGRDRPKRIGVGEPEAAAAGS